MQLVPEVVVDRNARPVVRTKNGKSTQVAVDALVRVMRGGIGDAVNEPVRSENSCSAGFPGMPGAMMWNLDRTDVCPALGPKVRLHLSEDCAVDA